MAYIDSYCVNAILTGAQELHTFYTMSTIVYGVIMSINDACEFDFQ